MWRGILFGFCVGTCFAVFLLVLGVILSADSIGAAPQTVKAPEAITLETVDDATDVVPSIADDARPVPTVSAVPDATGANKVEPTLGAVVTDDPVKPVAPDLGAGGVAAAPEAIDEASPSDTVTVAAVDALPEMVVAPPTEDTSNGDNVAIETVESTSPVVVGDDAPLAAVPAAVEPAITAFATGFAPIADAPMVSFIVLDDPKVQIAPAALASLPFPITVAINVGRADAQERAEAFGAAGIEVAVIGLLPRGVNVGGFKSTFDTYLSKVPRAVAVVDGAGLGIVSTPSVFIEWVPEFKDRGLGYLSTSDRRLSVVGVAQENNIPASVIFRDLDSNNQSAAVIRRFIAQGVSKSKPNVPSILKIKLREESLSALATWGRKINLSEVNVAPLSAALLAIR